MEIRKATGVDLATLLSCAPVLAARNKAIDKETVIRSEDG